MKINLYTLSLHEGTKGGSHTNCATYIRSLRKQGHTVNVHAILSGKPIDEHPLVVHDKDIILKSRWYDLGHYIKAEPAKMRFTQFARYVANIIEQDAYYCDVVFCYGHTLLWGAAMYAASGEKPVSVFIDQYLDTMPERGIRIPLLFKLRLKMWEKFVGLKLLKNIDRFMYCSSYIQHVYAVYGFPNKSIVMPNAFEFV